MRDQKLTDTFEALRADYTRSLVGTTPDQTSERDAFYTALRILDDVLRHLNALYADGRLAQRELDAMAQKVKRIA